MDLILNLEVRGEHAGRSRVLGVEGVLVISRLEHAGRSRVLGVEGVLETDDGFVALLGIRPLESKLVNTGLDVVEEEFDILFNVKERTDGVTVRGDNVDEHGDLGVHSLEFAAQTLEARKFDDPVKFSGVKVRLSLSGF